MLTVDLKVVEEAHPPENDTTEPNWECRSVIAGYTKNMQRTGHGEREAGVRRKGIFTRHVYEVGSEARSEQSAKEVDPQADPSAGVSSKLAPRCTSRRRPRELDWPVHVVEGPAGSRVVIDPLVQLFAERKLRAICTD